MTVNIRIAIMSHLSDAQELISVGKTDEAQARIYFAKYLLLQFPNPEVNVECSVLDKMFYEMCN